MPEQAAGPHIDPTHRVIVNQNYDTTNIVSMDDEDILQRLIKTLDSCEAVLRDHCGPQSGYAMLVENFSAGTNFQPNIFTRDGIRILSAMEFMSPLERHIKELLTYVGNRVDANAKDGTTTSMLFATIFLKHVLMERQYLKGLGLSIYQINKVVDTLFKNIQEELDKSTWTVEKVARGAGYTQPDEDVKESDAIRAAGVIAAMQALSSSGGNMQLALAMKEIFERSPKVAWEFISYVQSKRETGKSFQVDVDDFDSKIRCIAASDGNLNRAMNTEYLAEDVVCLIFPDALADGSMKTEGVERWLDQLATVEADHPVLLLATYFPAHLINKVNMLNQARGDNRITMWQYSPEQTIAGMHLPWELITLCAISGIEPMSMDTSCDDVELRHLFTAKEVYWHDSYLEFSGVVELPEGTCLHPFYADPDKATKFYKHTLQAVQDQLQMYQEGHKPDGRMMGLFIEILNKLACIRRPTLRLGGPVHEQLANGDVVQDVEGAIMSSLKYGFLANGVVNLFGVITKMENEIRDEHKFQQNIPNEKEISFALEILRYMAEALVAVLQATFHSDHRSVLMSMEEMQSPAAYKNVLQADEIFDMFAYIRMLEKTHGQDENVPQELYIQYPVAQPRAITTELLTRTKELLVKVISTNKIIVAGGVVASSEEPEEGVKNTSEGAPLAPPSEPLHVDLTQRGNRHGNHES